MLNLFKKLFAKELSQEIIDGVVEGTETDINTIRKTIKHFEAKKESFRIHWINCRDAKLYVEAEVRFNKMNAADRKIKRIIKHYNLI